jgi:hypothetical protein
MTYSSGQKDYLQPHSYDNSTFPQGLNVLSILTFIGSGVQLLGSVFNYFIVAYSVKQLETMKDIEKEPVMKGISPLLKWSTDATLKQYEHRLVLLIVSVVCAALCIYGALQMRKLKKQGFVIYSIAEFAFPVVTALLVGFLSAIFGLFIAALFTVLYATQRKHFTS